VNTHDSAITDFAARLQRHILQDQGIANSSFEPLALELFQLQFTLNVPYRRLCEARGACPGTVKVLEAIPAAPTTAFREFDFSCLPEADRSRVFHSSGTTGHRPSRHFHSANSLDLYETSLLACFKTNLIEDGTPRARLERLAVLTPSPVQAPHSSLVHMFEALRRDLGASASSFLGSSAADGAWSLDFDATARFFEEACRSATPALALGTAFSFVHLLDYLANQNRSFALPPGSSVMETGGYKGRSRTLPMAELHSLITRRLGIPPSRILREYGMSELSSQAYARAGSLVFQFPSWARARVISPETGTEAGEGEVGLVQVYDLANVFSVLAVQTEDLAVRHGTGFELIGRAELAEPRGCSLAAA